MGGGQKELLPPIVRSNCICTLGLGEVKIKEIAKEFSYAKEDPEETRGLATVKPRLFFSH